MIQAVIKNIFRSSLSLLKQVRSRVSNGAESHKPMTADKVTNNANKVRLEAYRLQRLEKNLPFYRKVVWSAFSIFMVYYLGASYMEWRALDLEFKKIKNQKDLD